MKVHRGLVLLLFVLSVAGCRSRSPERSPGGGEITLGTVEPIEAVGEWVLDESLVMIGDAAPVEHEGRYAQVSLGRSSFGAEVLEVTPGPGREPVRCFVEHKYGGGLDGIAYSFSYDLDYELALDFEGTCHYALTGAGEELVIVLHGTSTLRDYDPVPASYSLVAFR